MDRSWGKGTFFLGMRPAGNKTCTDQPLSCCFWLSAQAAFVFTQTQGQSSVTNNTISLSTEPSGEQDGAGGRTGSTQDIRTERYRPVELGSWSRSWSLT